MASGHDPFTGWGLCCKEGTRLTCEVGRLRRLPGIRQLVGVLLKRMDEPQRLRDLAARALRLARNISTPDVAATLKASAAEYTRLAAEMEAQKRPAQQQQQPQPDKKNE